MFEFLGSKAKGTCGVDRFENLGFFLLLVSPASILNKLEHLCGYRTQSISKTIPRLEKFVNKLVFHLVLEANMGSFRRR